ncbi:MAG: hypothetical protein WDN24_10035 [Sphingomonas sp.]
MEVGDERASGQGDRGARRARPLEALERVDATIVSGGGFFALKGLARDAAPRRMTAWLHEQRSSVQPYGAPDQRTMFTPAASPSRSSTARWWPSGWLPRTVSRGHQMHTPWDPLHRAYFNGEALWTYLATPFLLAMPGVRVEEIAPWREREETWRVLRAWFPGAIETHSAVQDFFFGEDFLLRRHDYDVNIAGGFGASQIVLDPVRADGIVLPARRRAYLRGPDRRPVHEMLMVSIDISDVRFV